MSRYVLLIIFNIPIILLGVLGVITKFKLNKISKRRFYAQLTFWIMVLISLAMIYPTYSYLTNNHLTDTEPLSLFDVVQITVIIFLLYTLNRSRARLESVETRLQDLHQELSIKLSDKES